ncbi:UNVERIFIED_CONTAM: protein SPIRAL1-like 2 [Sesamum radiatum]|uniref:Protein SPIRAL1-like 2 n=1 Tax=Sesamum radiatum TaxID=300843 RepID=A0AAW2VQA8_SESRA
MIQQKQAAEKMGRGTSAGGGQSSLGYLFGNGEAPNPPQEPKDAISEPSSKPTAPPAEVDSIKQTQTQTPAVNSGYSTNNYYRTDGQNCGNFITVHRYANTILPKACLFSFQHQTPYYDHNLPHDPNPIISALAGKLTSWSWTSSDCRGK